MVDWYLPTGKIRKDETSCHIHLSCPASTHPSTSGRNHGGFLFGLGLLRTTVEYKLSRIFSISISTSGHLTSGTCRQVYTLTDPLSTLPEIPTSYDLREAGLQVPVKDQGVCGSCWAFGTMTLAESSIIATRSRYTDTPQGPYFSDIVTEDRFNI